MSDVDDVFLPKPNDLLVNLSECRAAVESLLGRLNDMFADNHTIGSALGPAIQSGFKLIVRSPHYRKPGLIHFLSLIRVPLVVNSSFCPPVYRVLELALSRTGKIQKYLVLLRSVRYTLVSSSFFFTSAQESGLLQTASPFYKSFAIECSRAQVSVDMFLFSAAYQDVATLGIIPFFDWV